MLTVWRPRGCTPMTAAMTERVKQLFTTSSCASCSGVGTLKEKSGTRRQEVRGGAGAVLSLFGRSRSSPLLACAPSSPVRAPPLSHTQRARQGG